MLQSEGLVEGEPNRRVRVAPMTARDLEELCIMRVTLEAEALRLSVPSMTSEDLARLEGHMAEMAHYADAEGLPPLERPARALPPRAHRARGRAGQLRARSDVRPRRALPAAAHRPRPERLGDAPAPRHPRRLQGRGPRQGGRPAGRAPRADRARGLRAARPRLRPRSCCAPLWSTPAATCRSGRRASAHAADSPTRRGRRAGDLPGRRPWMERLRSHGEGAAG